jgi:hypothetical protein
VAIPRSAALPLCDLVAQPRMRSRSGARTNDATSVDSWARALLPCVWPWLTCYLSCVCYGAVPAMGKGIRLAMVAVLTPWMNECANPAPALDEPRRILIGVNPLLMNTEL